MIDGNEVKLHARVDDKSTYLTPALKRAVERKTGLCFFLSSFLMYDVNPTYDFSSNQARFCIIHVDGRR